MVSESKNKIFTIANNILLNIVYIVKSNQLMNFIKLYTSNLSLVNKKNKRSKKTDIVFFSGNYSVFEFIYKMKTYGAVFILKLH